MSGQLFRVDVERTLTAVFYVEADDLEGAREDAEALACELNVDDWSNEDDSVDVSLQVGQPRSESWVWTGGEKGKAVAVSDWSGEAA